MSIRNKNAAKKAKRNVLSDGQGATRKKSDHVSKGSKKHKRATRDLRQKGEG